MSTKSGFIHLHLHSEYSLLDGGNRIDRLISRVKELEMPAVAVTDHGNLFGAIEFYSKAKNAGIKPILGIEAYVAPGDRTDKSPTGIADGGFHLVLLAENETGWRNLLKLSSDSFLNGFYYKPRMDKSTLKEHAEGLIAINGHLGSSIAHHLLKFEQSKNEEHFNHAIEEAKWHAETFTTTSSGDPCFFVELQRHEVDEQTRINPHLIRLARELELPLVCDNDAHFLTADDWDAHDTLCCISMQKIKTETERIKYPRSLYVKSAKEMEESFIDLPETLENTVRIADRCNVEIDFNVNLAPVVKIVYQQQNGNGESADAAIPSNRESILHLIKDFQSPYTVGSTEWYNAFCKQFDLEPFDEQKDHDSAEELKVRCDKALRLLAEAGAIWRYGEDGFDEEKRQRLDRELNILADKLISAYFLIVWDFVNWARQRGIPANARGSGVGTMVGYVLGLSNACPVEYGLLFERFTDPDRSEYPDIDVDMCQDGRAAVINYVRNKYGHVAQIITFGRLKAKAAIKDVARVMGLSPTEGQRLSNLIPSELNITIDDALSREPELKQQYENDVIVKRVIDHARSLENHARHAGVHAAGVVIATQPLDNIVPLCRATGNDDVVTQWDGPTCEKVGLLKMDFLGLRTLSTIERAKKLIQETLKDDEIWKAVGLEKDSGPHPLDLDRLIYNDQTVLDIFRRGDTAGVFQFESGGMRQLLMEMQPDRLEDLIAANALYRPGPMDLIPEYNMRKRGRQAVPKVHEIVDKYTEETYGIMVYQEQVMQIVHGLGDIPLRAAYSLIKAISKKRSDIIDGERPKFIEGAKEKGLSERNANDLFDLILKFAGYGFNKSHSTGYAIIAYQTAYLKTYFPNQYMAALLTYESRARKVEDWVPYLEDCRKTPFPDSTKKHPHVGVDVLHPEINHSAADFTVVFREDEPQDNLHGHIRFGLGALKGAGNSAIGTIINEREENGPFESLFDFCERVDLRNVNKATMEALVKCGAMDSLHGFNKRSSMVASIEDAITSGQAAAKDKAAGQSTFFDSFAEADPTLMESKVRLRNVPEWSQMDALQYEKDVLGIYVSGHPLDMHKRTIKAFCKNSIREMEEMKEDTMVILGGIIIKVRPAVAKSGRNAGARMAFLTLQDKTGSIEGVVFSDAYAKHIDLIQQDRMVIVIAKVDRRRAEPSMVVERVIDIEAAPKELAIAIEVNVNASNEDDDIFNRKISEIRDVLKSAAGDTNAAAVLLNIHVDAKCYCLRPGVSKVIADKPLISRLESILGEDALRFRGGPVSQYITKRNSNGYRKWEKTTPTVKRQEESCASIDRY